MKRIFASAGLAAFGAVTLQGAPDGGLSTKETSKPWSISASVRGFFDSNYAQVGDALNPAESFGFDVKPGGTFRLNRNNTTVSLGYEFGAKFFGDEDVLGNDRTIFSHSFRGEFSHAFSDTLKLEVSDYFDFAQDPRQLTFFGATSVVDFENITNDGTVALTKQFAGPYSLTVKYQNRYVNFKENGLGSISALLDRIENRPSVELYRTIKPNVLDALVGYELEDIQFISQQPIAVGLPKDVRNRRSHNVYVGARYRLAKPLVINARIGGQATQYPNIDAEDDASTNPFAEASLTWIYYKDSTFTFGVRHGKDSIDLAGVFGGTSPILDENSTFVWTEVNHAITKKLHVRAGGYVRTSQFQGKNNVLNGRNETLGRAFLEGRYQINQFLAAEAGYSFLSLESDVDDTTGLGQLRGFNRTSVFLGVRATY